MWIGPSRVKATPVAGDAGGHDAVEHVDAAGDHFEDLGRGAEAHGVAGLVGRQEGHRVLDGAEHLLLGLADRDAADGVAVEVEVDQFAGRLLAEVGPDRALDDAEMVLPARRPSGVGCRSTQSLQRRAQRVVRAERFGGVVALAGVGRALVEEHRDVRAERGLDFHAELGGEQHRRCRRGGSGSARPPR